MADSMSSPSNSGLQQQSASVTVVETETEQEQEVATLKLRLKKPSTDKKVQWTTGTVDNEDMNKKKSKCCCIYTKPRSLEEESSSSSSDSEDDECETCKGHIKRKKKKLDHECGNVQQVSSTNDNDVSSSDDKVDTSVKADKDQNK